MCIMVPSIVIVVIETTKHPLQQSITTFKPRSAGFMTPQQHRDLAPRGIQEIRHLKINDSRTHGEIQIRRTLVNREEMSSEVRGCDA